MDNYIKYIKRQVNKYHYKHNKYKNNILKKNPNIYIRRFINKYFLAGCDFEILEFPNKGILVLNGVEEQYIYPGKIWFKTNNKHDRKVLKKYKYLFEVNDYLICCGTPNITSDYYLKDNKKIYTSEFIIND